MTRIAVVLGRVSTEDTDRVIETIEALDPTVSGEAMRDRDRRPAAGRAHPADPARFPACAVDRLLGGDVASGNAYAGVRGEQRSDRGRDRGPLRAGAGLGEDNKERVRRGWSRPRRRRRKRRERSHGARTRLGDLPLRIQLLLAARRRGRQRDSSGDERRLSPKCARKRAARASHRAAFGKPPSIRSCSKRAGAFCRSTSSSCCTRSASPGRLFAVAALHLFALLCRPPLWRRCAAQARCRFARLARAAAFVADARGAGRAAQGPRPRDVARFAASPRISIAFGRSARAWARYAARAKRSR